MLSNLISEIDDHLAWRALRGAPLAETTFGLRAVNDGKLVERLRQGGQVTVGKMGAIRDWMRADKREVERRGVAA